VWKLVVDLKYCSQWCGWCSNGVDGSYEVVLENSLGGVERSFLVLLDLRWVTVPKLVFGMAYGMGHCPLRECIWNCLALLIALGMLSW
jgi:hypothetical protein